MQIPSSNSIITPSMSEYGSQEDWEWFDKIHEQMSNKLEGWKTRVLYQAGKVVLFKLNLSGILLYTMHGIRIPSIISKELDCETENYDGAIILILININP